MARKMFTQEQVRIMAENPYTLHVSTTQITFTNAFKEEFWQRYQEGDTPRTILYDLGYDPEVLGRNRVSGIQNVVCKRLFPRKGFMKGHSASDWKCLREKMAQPRHNCARCSTGLNIWSRR